MNFPVATSNATNALDFSRDNLVDDEELGPVLDREYEGDTLADEHIDTSPMPTDGRDPKV